MSPLIPFKLLLAKPPISRITRMGERIGGAGFIRLVCVIRGSLAAKLRRVGLTLWNVCCLELA